ncbi:lambda-crystallin homolog [Xenia sp. Carnegie-2017]|uniref:lambda-crystallin homolog n=1 Tax=Xenia sp. Carnegie-2017 TaxID=2897299 RepID=UPI001F037232|nr:lambda-crystallin homolog [Xenia sp. Carnegie-2017]
MAENRRGKVAIIGSGMIGKSWSVLFCRAGYEVYLYDIDEKQVDSGLSGILESLKEFESKGLLKNSFIKSADDAFKLVHGCLDLAKTVDGAIYVQENAPENVNIKKKVFENLDNVIKDDQTILASSSSCIVPSRFSEHLNHRKQCVVAHPVNPPHFVPLVEIVPAPWTDPDVVSRTRSLMKDIGQSPVTLNKEVDGFLLNRIQYAIIMEGWRLVEDGLCSPEDVDTVMSKGLGLRYSFMGPFETMHLNAPKGL